MKKRTPKNKKKKEMKKKTKMPKASLTRENWVSGDQFSAMRQICSFSFRHEANLLFLVGHRTSLTRENWVSGG